MKVYGLKALFEKQKGNIREIRPVWALEELAVPYDLILLDPKTREHKNPEFLKINPFGKVPVVVDGDVAVFESAAICNYLGDKYGKLIPAPKSKERVKYDQWVFASLATIEPHAVRIFACDVFLDQNEKTAAIREFSAGILPGFLKVLDDHLAQNEFMLGSDFSLADVATTGAVHFVQHTQMLEPHKNLTRFLDSMYGRPAYRRARELNAPMA